jgi:hypothetical protein
MVGKESHSREGLDFFYSLIINGFSLICTLDSIYLGKQYRNRLVQNSFRDLPHLYKFGGIFLPHLDKLGGLKFKMWPHLDKLGGIFLPISNLLSLEISGHQHKTPYVKALRLPGLGKPKRFHYIKSHTCPGSPPRGGGEVLKVPSPREMTQHH